MAAAVDQVVGEHGAVGVLVNNAGYSQSGARRDRHDGRRAPPVRDQRLRPDPDVPARPAVACARADVAGSSTSARWAAASRSRAVASTTRPSTPWRRCPTRCGSRSRDSASTSSIIEPGLIRTSFAETAAASISDATTAPTPTSTQRSRAATEGVYHGPAGQARRRARCGGQGDREGDHRAPTADPLPGHPFRAAVHGTARPPSRPGLGRDGRVVVPAPLLTGVRDRDGDHTHRHLRMGLSGLEVDVLPEGSRADAGAGVRRREAHLDRDQRHVLLAAAAVELRTLARLDP